MDKKPNITTGFVTNFNQFSNREIKSICKDYFDKANHQTIINLLEDDDFSLNIYQVGEGEDNEIYIKNNDKDKWQIINRVD